ncbi:MAG TPA: xanthine dehydrogenase family protein molybdopterin-binding subunit [Terriglobales bacterium]|jgi:CO/xanthine dehydrogenase Mo-binding subunit
MSPISRREFVAAGVAAGAGLVIGFTLPRAASNGTRPFAPNAYLTIHPDGKISVTVARSEMGQGVHTSLPMILAEELEVDLNQITVEQAGASTLYGDQTTGGSASVRSSWGPLRRAGAAAREMLVAAAALQWGVPRAACKAEHGAVTHAASNRRLTYGELANRASALPVPTDPKLKDPKDYKLVGTRASRNDSAAKVKGEARYGIDFRLPNMKFAVLARCPVFGGKVASFDDKEARKIAGITYVGKISDSAVAVVGDSSWAAMEGRRVLNVAWDEGAHKELNSVGISNDLKQAASSGKSFTLYSAGDVAKASGRRVEAAYELPFMAHAPMEPGNSTAHFQGTKCEIWEPTQVPQDVRDSAATALGLDPDQVTVNLTLLGGGFGRRLEHDFGVEAALVSKAVNAPVQVFWTREDDLRNSTYRPASYHKLSGALDGQGWPVSFSHRIVMPSINIQKGFPAENGLDTEIRDESSFVYGIPNLRIDHVMTETPVPLGWMRSVNAMNIAFASESFLDELAVAGGKDPLELRLHLLSKDDDLNGWHPARMRGVLQLAADKAGWSKPLPSGHYHGLACFACFNSYVAEVVEISMENNEPRVHRVVGAIDCGQVINPGILEQQIQSGVIFALSNALRAKVTIEKGRVVQGNFDDYQPVRINEAPAVEAYFIESHETPTGAGEPPVPPLAPALCNAIFAATRKRIRSLPVLA